MVELSRAQRRIVQCPDQGCHLLVLAGPGSGKTRTVVERVGHLLRGGCSAERMLVMTFTLKAAEELRDRLGAQGQAGVWAGTFHHVCARLLTDYGAAIGIRPPLRIYDEPKQRDAIERAAKVAAFVFDKRGELTFQAARNHISRRKCAGLRAGEWRSDWGHRAVSDHLQLIDEAYDRLMAGMGALDYDDLLVGGIRLLREDDETATLLRRRFGFVLVDEFHDVSPEQYELIRALAPPRMPSPPTPLPSEAERGRYQR